MLHLLRCRGSRGLHAKHGGAFAGRGRNQQQGLKTWSQYASSPCTSSPGLILGTWSQTPNAHNGSQSCKTNSKSLEQEVTQDQILPCRAMHPPPPRSMIGLRSEWILEVWTNQKNNKSNPTSQQNTTIQYEPEEFSKSLRFHWRTRRTRRHGVARPPRLAAWLSVLASPSHGGRPRRFRSGSIRRNGPNTSANSGSLEGCPTNKVHGPSP